MSSDDGAAFTLHPASGRENRKKGRKQMEGKVRARNEEAARRFYCKCCIHTAHPVARQRGR